MQSLDELIFVKQAQRKGLGLKPLVVEVVQLREQQIKKGRIGEFPALGESRILLAILCASENKMDEAISQAKSGLQIFLKLQEGDPLNFEEQIAQLRRMLGLLESAKLRQPPH